MKLYDLITWSKICKCNLLFNGVIIQDQNEFINQILSISKSENFNQLSIELDTTYNELYLFRNNKRQLSLKKVLSWCNLLNQYPEIKPIINA